MAEKINFVIEMENGQYLRATNDIIKSTEKVERQTTKSYKKMDNVGNEFHRKMRRYFSFGALFGGAFGLAFGAVHKMFAAWNQGVTNAINKNKQLKDTFDDIKQKSDDVWTAIGEKIAPVLAEIGKFVYDILDSNNSLIKLKAGMSEDELRKALVQIKAFLDQAKQKGIDVNDSKNYWNVYVKQQEEVEKKLKRYDDERQKRREEQIKRLKQLNEEYNSSISKLADKVTDVFGLDSTTKEFFGALKDTSTEMNKITSAMDEAAKSGKKLSLSFDSMLGIAIAIYSVLSFIVVGLIKMTSENTAAQDALKELNDQTELYQSKVENINRELKKITAELEKQQMIDNDSLEAIDAEVKIYEDLIKKKQEEIALDKDKIKNAKGDTARLNAIKKGTEDQIKIMEDQVKFFKENPIGIALNVIGFGGPLAGAEARLKFEKDNLALIEEKIKQNKEALDLEVDLADKDNEIFKLTKEMNELLKERTVLLQKQAIETGDLEERLLNAKLEGAESDKDSIKIIDSLVANIEKQVAAYREILAVTTDKNDQLETEAEIQEHLNQITDLRKKAEEIITQQISKQVSLMQKYVSLGLDLENVRVVKQLTSKFAAQGLNGIELGGALQDVGVKSSAIGGKVLNIYGDINNTLNQASPNALIGNMNNLINKIGGGA